MRRLMICLGLCSFAFLGTMALAQLHTLAELTTPTEVGTTIIPSGTYIMMDQTTGKSYALTVTSRGNMILAPAPAAQGLTGAPATRSGLGNILQREMQRGVTNVIQRGGASQLQNLIK